MIPRDELEHLQNKCKAIRGCKNLYAVVRLEQPLEHARLKEELIKKKNAFRKMSGRAENLAAIELALKLLKTPADQEAYDRFLQEESERKQEPQPTWGIGVGSLVGISLWIIRFFAELAGELLVGMRKLLVGISLWTLRFFARLAVVAVGISLLVLLVAELLNRLDLTTITWNRGGAPSGESTSSEGETLPPRSSASENAEERPARPDPRPPNRDTPSDVTPAPNAAAPARPAAPGPAPPPARPDPRPPNRDTPSVRPPTAAAPARPAAPGPAPPPARPDPRPPNRDTPSVRPPTAAAPARPPVVEPVRVGGNVPRPRKTSNVTPEYPRLPRLRRIQGIVILEVTVDRRGGVSNVSVLRAAGEGFDEAAVEAVRQWRYEPTMVNGRPVSVILTETVRFEY